MSYLDIITHPDRALLKLSDEGRAIVQWTVGTPTSPVSWDKELHRFVTEASDIAYDGGPVALRSSRTGKLEVFNKVAVVRDAYDEDIVHWLLRSIAPQGPTFDLVIYND